YFQVVNPCRRGLARGGGVRGKETPPERRTNPGGSPRRRSALMAPSPPPSVLLFAAFFHPVWPISSARIVPARSPRLMVQKPPPRRPGPHSKITVLPAR